MTTESKPDEILSAPTETEMNDRRAAACIFELRDAIDRLTERCSAYKGQIEAGAKRIEMAEAETARLAESDRAVARVWKALGIAAYTGKEISEHVAELKAENARLAGELFETQLSLENMAKDAGYLGERLTAAKAENARLAKELASAERFRDAAVGASDFFAAKLVTAEVALSEARAETDSAEVRMHQAITDADAARAEGWRHGIEAARQAGWDCHPLTGRENTIAPCKQDAAEIVARAIRALPLPVSGVVEGEKLDE